MDKGAPVRQNNMVKYAYNVNQGALIKVCRVRPDVKSLQMRGIYDQDTVCGGSYITYWAYFTNFVKQLILRLSSCNGRSDLKKVTIFILVCIYLDLNMFRGNYCLCLYSEDCNISATLRQDKGATTRTVM